MRKILFFICFVLVNLSFAQNSKKIDSLETLIKQAKEIEKISLLCEISKEYIPVSHKKAFGKAYTALQIALQKQKPQYVSESYFTLGIIHYSTSNYDSAKYYFDKALITSTIPEKSVLILDNIGNLYKDKSIYDSSLLTHNQALKLKETLGDRKGVALTYTNIGNVYMQMHNYEDAIEQYEKALKIRKTLDDKQSYANLLTNIGDAYKNLLEYEKALSFLNKALQIHKENNDNPSIAYTLNGIGNFYFQLKIYDKAQEFYTKALLIRNELGNKNDIAASTFNIATVHRDIGNYKEALKYYKMALHLRKQTGVKEAEALTLTAIGGVYKNKKQYSFAIQNYELALAMHQKMGSTLNIANAYERIGIAYKDTCVYDKAEYYYKKALENFEKINNLSSIARIYNYLGNLYKEKQNFNYSLSYYKKSLTIFDSTKNLSGMAYTTYNIGDLYQKSSQLNNAITYFEKAKHIAEKCNEYNLIETTSLTLYSIFKEKHDYAKALTYYEDYTAIRDTIAHHKNLQRIAELEFESSIKYLEQVNENQKLKLQKEKSKQFQITVYLIIALLILIGIVVFSVLLYKQFTQKKKAFNLLSEKSDELKDAYEELENINSVLHEKNEKITDSLSYAKRIQKTILPQDSAIEKIFPHHFIFYVPKEIVSGDFYWFAEHEEFAFFAVVDCTGHGVPGAFMSMVGNTLLNQIVNEQHILQPSQILQKLDAEIIKTLRQYDERTNQEDGMEISLLRLEKSTKKILFSGAGHKLIIVKNKELECIQTTHFSIGGMHEIKQDYNITFTEIELQLEPNSTIYMYTDGFIDQFGYEFDERYNSGRFQKLISEIQHFDINEQYVQLSKTFDDWKGTNTQTDDVLVVGIKVGS